MPTKSVPIQIRVDEKVAADLETLAEGQGLTRATYVRTLVYEHLTKIKAGSADRGRAA